MKPMSDKDFIPPFICKTFKVIPNGISEDGSVILDTVEVLSDVQLSQIKTMTRKTIKVGSTIRQEDLEKRIAEMFSEDPKPKLSPISQDKERPRVQPEAVKPKESQPTPEPQKIEQVKYEPDVVGADDFIRTLPLSVLEKEIKRRYLSKNVTGVITISPEGTKVSIASIPWPTGIYQFEMKYISEIVEEKKDSQLAKEG